MHLSIKGIAASKSQPHATTRARRKLGNYSSEMSIGCSPLQRDCDVSRICCHSGRNPRSLEPQGYVCLSLNCLSHFPSIGGGRADAKALFCCADSRPHISYWGLDNSFHEHLSCCHSRRHGIYSADIYHHLKLVGSCVSNHHPVLSEAQQKV